MARQALFPETILDGQEVISKEDSEEDIEADSDDEDLNALLSTLAGWDSDRKSESKDITSGGLFESSSYSDVLTNELQAWRSQHAEKPYNDWSKEKKDEFDVSSPQFPIVGTSGTHCCCCCLDDLTHIFNSIVLLLVISSHGLKHLLFLLSPNPPSVLSILKKPGRIC
jgi:hypothetical protein